MITLLKFAHIMYKHNKKLHRLILFYITLPFYYIFLKICKLIEYKNRFKYYININNYGNKVTVTSKIKGCAQEIVTLPFIGTVKIELTDSALDIRARDRYGFWSCMVMLPEFLTVNQNEICFIVDICNLVFRVDARVRDMKQIRTKLIKYING